MPDNIWDNVPEEIRPVVDSLPELAEEDNPYLKALPEFANLAKYGGKTLEDNLKAAAARLALIQGKIGSAAIKARALDARNPLINSNYEVSRDLPFMGEDVSALAEATLLSKILTNSKVNSAIKTLTGEKSRGFDISPNTKKDLAFLIKFLRSDDPNKSIDEVVAEALNSGFKIVPKNGVVSSVGDIRVPFSINQEGLVEPSVDTSGYKNSISALDEFVAGRILPRTFQTEKISIRIAATQADFEAQYKSISPVERDMSTVQGVNFTLRSDGTQAQRSTDLNRSMQDMSSVIIINHEVNATTKGEFGGEDSIAETVLHEYAHTVHKSMGISWGDPKQPDLNPKTAKYSAVKAQDVSAYGNNNIQEHFAETFAKYLYTGKGTPEFEAFLEEEVELKKFSVNDVYPELLLGNSLRDRYLEGINANLDGYTIKLTEFTNPLTNYSAMELANLAKSHIKNGTIPKLAITMRGTAYDSQGRAIGDFTRTLNHEPDGSLWMYHNLFELRDNAQGGGFGTKFTDAAFKIYKDMGLDRVEVTGGLSNGRYMWARQGFDFMHDSSRREKLATLAKYTEVLSEFNKNKDEYESLDTPEVSRRIKESLDAASPIGVSRLSTLDIKTYILEARKNGWNIDNNFINELMFLLKLPPSSVTAQQIADLANENRKSLDRNSSSIGRIVMNEGGTWRGVRKV